MKRISQYKFYLLTLCFFMGTVVSLSQNENMDWSAESYLLTANGTDVEITSNLSKEGSTLVWDQIGYNTSNTDTFTVTSVNGNWDTQDSLGELQYDLTSDGALTASLTVTGTTEGITILLVINGENNATQYGYTFHIETFNNL